MRIDSNLVTVSLQSNSKCFWIEIDWLSNQIFTALIKTILLAPSFSAGRSDRVQMRAELTKINSVISEHTSNLLPYQFLTAFSQLISRICHSNNEVFAVLMEIVAKVFLAYPQQAMWMMTAVSKVRHLSHIYIYKCLFAGLYASVYMLFKIYFSPPILLEWTDARRSWRRPSVWITHLGNLSEMPTDWLTNWWSSAINQ